MSAETNHILDTWEAKTRKYHAEEVAKGLHDEECEWGPRLAKSWHEPHEERQTFFHMCHCAKRRRLAEGQTKVPGALWTSNPTCPRCYREVDFDGDGFTCGTCHVNWDSTNPDDEGTFNDDHGDLGRPVE